MKALVKYADKLYLVRVKEKKVDYDKLFDIVNKGRWPDECHYKEWIVERSQIIAFMTDESEFAS